MDFAALWVSLKLAAATTAILALVGLPLSYWLATTTSRFRFLVQALVTLPLVLPPTVLGFYVLVATSPQNPVGRWYESLTGSSLAFSFAGILLASVLFNLPFAVRPFTSALEAVDRRLIEASWCLGESRWRTFLRTWLPLSWPGILAGMILTFTHTLGEFGVVLMVGGNLPGLTRTLSIAIYDDVQALDYASAGRTAAVLVVTALFALCLVQFFTRRRWAV